MLGWAVMPRAKMATVMVEVSCILKVSLIVMMVWWWVRWRVKLDEEGVYIDLESHVVPWWGCSWWTSLTSLAWLWESNAKDLIDNVQIRSPSLFDFRRCIYFSSSFWLQTKVSLSRHTCNSSGHRSSNHEQKIVNCVRLAALMATISALYLKVRLLLIYSCTITDHLYFLTANQAKSEQTPSSLMLMWWGKTSCRK